MIELWEGEEVGQKKSVIAFHDDGGGEEDGPRGSFWIKPECSHDGHPFLAVGTDSSVIVESSESRVGDRGPSYSCIGKSKNIGILGGFLNVGATSLRHRVVWRLKCE